jgi:hypothetical protein
LSQLAAVAIINTVPRAFSKSCSFGSESRNNQREANDPSSPAVDERVPLRGQVAQVVERSPEKAGVGGSTPSLATIILKNLAAESRNFQPTIQPMILTELAP